MLKSMTGYGEAAQETDRFRLSIEVRSVNHRFLKVNAKIPEEVSFLQNGFETVVKQRVSRGSVALTLRFEPAHPADLYEVDEELLKKYLRTLENLNQELGREETVSLSELLLLPGVITTEESLLPEKEGLTEHATATLGKALDRLVEMRRREGSNLEADLRSRSEILATLLVKIEEEAPRAIVEHQRKMDLRVKQLLGDQQALLAPGDLLKEIAILADRADISEEISRMASHIEQFRETLESDEAVGRKLEFIVQEMFRESNTMGSKSVSSQLDIYVVNMKAEVERLKEQIANIE